MTEISVQIDRQPSCESIISCFATWFNFSLVLLTNINFTANSVQIDRQPSCESVISCFATWFNFSLVPCPFYQHQLHSKHKRAHLASPGHGAKRSAMVHRPPLPLSTEALLKPSQSLTVPRTVPRTPFLAASVEPGSKPTFLL